MCDMIYFFCFDIFQSSVVICIVSVKQGKKARNIMERFCIGVTCTQRNYEEIQKMVHEYDDCWKIDGVLPSSTFDQYTLFWYWADQHLVDQLRQTVLTDAVATYVCENGSAYTEHYGDKSLNHPCDFGIFFNSNPTVGQVYSVSSSLWLEFPDKSVVLLTSENISLYRNMLVKELKVKLHGLTACVFT
jgi:hypothetical protein